MTEDLVGKLNELKSNIQSLWSKITENDFEMKNGSSHKGPRTIHDVYANDYDHNHAEDLPLTINRDPDPGVNNDDIKYYTTENSPLSVGAQKVEGGGIDKFGGEDDIVSEGSEKNVSSRLSERFYTH